jgi:hypothetical protein
MSLLGASFSQQQMTKIAINLSEKDIIKLIIEFLANRELNISMLDLERETGIINSNYSDDILFLRQLILDGQWDDAIEFIQPLKQIEQFNSKYFYYLILKSQYLELLCLKSEANTVDNQLSVDQLVTYLNELHQYCPSEDEYKKLCLLLTSTRIQDHHEYRFWNPSSGRLHCFKEILPLISKFIPIIDTSRSNSSSSGGASMNQISQNERLIQLIVKGLLYESCVEYCQARATNSIETYNISDPNVLLMNQNLSETDASLLSWLHALSVDTFSCPFEEKPLKLHLDKFLKPALEATWAEAILATPIKPLQLFPYNAVPSGRSKNMELMSRSLAPQYEGLTFGLTKSQLFTSGIEMKLNQQPNNNNSHQNDVQNKTNKKLNELTKSIGLLNTGGDLNGIKEEELVSSPTGSTTSSSNSSSNASNPNKTNQIPQQQRQSQQVRNSMQDSTLFLEYKKHKQQVIQQIEEQEKKREEYVKQLKTPNVHNALSSLQFSISSNNNNNNNNQKSNRINSSTNEDEASFVSPRSTSAIDHEKMISSNCSNNSDNNINNKSSSNTITNVSDGPGGGLVANNSNMHGSDSLTHQLNQIKDNFMKSPISSSGEFGASSSTSSNQNRFNSNVNNNINNTNRQTNNTTNNNNSMNNSKNMSDSTRLESIEVRKY